MTAQACERLLMLGEEHSMCTEPLDHYFHYAGVRPELFWPSTDLWRGYIGTWEIRDDRLYLLGVKGQYEDGTQLTLEAIFPGFPSRVFAHWFTGTLRVVQGELIRYVHSGYASTYEMDLLIDVEFGVVIARRFRHNDPADDRYGDE
jgi:hypothetical protein